MCFGILTIFKPLYQIIGKAIVQIAFRWVGDCSWEQSHGKDCKSVAGLGGPAYSPYTPLLNPPDNEKNEINEVTDTTKALRAWIAEYENQIKESPDLSPAKDKSILKLLIKTHGLEKVLKKIHYHIAEGKMLSIQGFKIRFNDLGVNISQSSGTKKRLQIERLLSGTKKRLPIERMLKEFREKSGDVVDIDFRKNILKTEKPKGSIQWGMVNI